MNIAIIFAVVSLTSLSRSWIVYLFAGLAVVSAVGYALGLGALRVHPDSVDCLLALLFVLAYLAALVFLAFAKPKRAPAPWSGEPIRA
jgi:hypothetical protein